MTGLHHTPKELPMPSNKPTAPVRRYASDARSRSQLQYLRSVSVLALGNGRPPSDSTLIRRAIARYVEHVRDMIEAGRLQGLPGPDAQDVDSERKAINEHARIVTADLPRTLVDSSGRLNSWQEAIAAAIDNGLAIPTKAGA